CLIFMLRMRRSPTATLFPYTTLFRSGGGAVQLVVDQRHVVQGDLLDERVPVGEPPVEGGDADAGAPGDLLQRCVDALLEEDLSGRADDLLAVAAGVRPQPVRALGQPVPFCSRRPRDMEGSPPIVLAYPQR